jgi:hypothetical protein
MGFICPECYWECDPGEDYEYGPNRVSLEQARKNFVLYRACDPHGYWCRYYKDLPAGVDDRDPEALFFWRMAAWCPECHNFTGAFIPCPDCEGDK